MSDVVRRRIAAGLLIAGIAVAAFAGAEPRTVLLLSEDGEWRVSDPG